jgi:hypothetical protein
MEGESPIMVDAGGPPLLLSVTKRRRAAAAACLFFHSAGGIFTELQHAAREKDQEKTTPPTPRFQRSK